MSVTRSAANADATCYTLGPPGEKAGKMRTRICPHCGAATAVVDVRDVGRGEGEHTRGRRECLKCGFRCSTREVAHAFLATRARPAARKPVPLPVPAIPPRTNQECELHRYMSSAAGNRRTGHRICRRVPAGNHQNIREILVSVVVSVQLSFSCVAVQSAAKMVAIGR